MSWVCPICSNPNEDSAASCFVCGGERPAVSVSTSLKSTSSESTSSKSLETSEEVAECNIFYSDSAAFVASTKRGFEKFGKKMKSLFKKKPKKEKKVSVKEKKKSKLKTPILLKFSKFAEPWPEHRIKFDISVIKDKGYVRSERKDLGGVKGYVFFREDGSNQFIRAEMLIIQKMAHKR